MRGGYIDGCLVHCADSEGRYLGLVAPSMSAQVVFGPPPDSGQYLWDSINCRWNRVFSLSELQGIFLAEIDSAAGDARLRYITDVPGQQVTYLRKADQAVAYLAGGCTGTAPPYVAADAQALGVTAEQAARQIVAVSELWDNQVGPGIELARRAGKLAVAAAATVAQAQAARDTALQTLSRI